MNNIYDAITKAISAHWPPSRDLQLLDACRLQGLVRSALFGISHDPAQHLVALVVDGGDVAAAHAAEIDGLEPATFHRVAKNGELLDAFVADQQSTIAQCTTSTATSIWLMQARAEADPAHHTP